MIAALLFGFAAFAQNETPPRTTAAGEAVESAADEVGEVGRQPGGDVDLRDDLADETSESSTVPSLEIEEFVITGKARTSMVEDDTISVVGFDAEVVILEGIRDLRDLSNFTPGLEVKSAFAASNPTIYIRGVGLDDFNANAASAVAIYQDGVYMQSPAGQLFQFYDVAQVEVLRGPQGTLYRSASAGAILLTSKKPTDEFSSYLTATYGSYNLLELEGALGGPIVPGYLSGRLSASWGIRDGITENRCAEGASEPDGNRVPYPCNQATRDGVRVVDPGIDKWTNDVDYFAARGQLLLMLPLANHETEWLLNVHGGQNRSRAFQYQHRAASRTGYDRSNYRDNDGGDPFAGDYNIDGPENIDLLGINLRGTWLFGSDPGYEVVSLTAYEWHDLFRQENTDGGARLLLETTYADTAWQLSEQLELRGPIRESRYGGGDWTLGVYYLQDELDAINFFDEQGSANLLQEYTQEMWNAAAYGQLEYRLQPRCEPISCDFTFLAGLRYNWEHKSFDTVVVETPTRAALRDTLTGQNATLWAGPSGELSAAWNFTDSSNIYVKYARGWKGGHFNGGATSIFDIITPVKPEIVDSYEAGLRSFWFDDRFMFNLTGFYYDYQDLQVFVVEQTPLGYPIPKLANAGDAFVYGVELDLQAEPISGLYITFNGAWVESEYKDFVVSFSDVIRLPGPSSFIIERKFDYTGNTLIASPNFSVTSSIGYDIPLPGQVAGRGLGTLTPRFSFSWKDDMLFDPCGGRGIRCNFAPGFFGQDDYWIFNGALSWTSEGEVFRVTGWIHNFMDEHYKTQILDRTRGIGVILDAYADPRTYGVTATLAF